MGKNKDGQLGNGRKLADHGPTSLTHEREPSRVLEHAILREDTLDDTILAIEGSASHSLFLTSSGAVFGSGSNSHGQLAHALMSTSFTTPEHFPQTGTPSKRIIQIAVGNSFSVCLAEDKTVWGTGANVLGELGLGDTVLTVTSLTRINTGSLTDKPIVQISASYQSTLFLDASGRVHGTGYSQFGQLGLGHEELKVSTPAQIPMEGVLYGKVITHITVAHVHSLLIDENGAVYGMGSNLQGELGQGARGPPQLSPVAIMWTEDLMPAPRIVRAAGYLAHTLLLSDTGRVFGMGFNEHHSLGLDPTFIVSPMEVHFEQKIVNIATGEYCSVFLDASQVLWAAGLNDGGECGLAMEIMEATLPTKTVFPSVSLVAKGDSWVHVMLAHSCPPGTLTAGDNKCTECPEGDYCTSPSTQHHCPPSQWSRPGAAEFSDCRVEYCPAGYTCQFGHMDTCSPGYWRNGTEIECSPCPYGSACYNGTISLCDHGTLYAAGTGYGQMFCSECPPGKYVIREGSSAFCVTCPIGSACPGDGHHQTCRGNKYAPTIGLVNCSVCETGAYTQDSSAFCTECPLSFMCPDGVYAYKCDPSVSEACTYCAPGFRAEFTQGAVQCLPCAESHYCPDGHHQYACKDGMTAPVVSVSEVACVNCDKGYACAQGTKTPCYSPLYANVTGATHCSTCPPGFHTGDLYAGIVATTCGQCKEGYYCEDGMQAKACPPGTWTHAPGAQHVSSCVKCESNYVCLMGTQTVCNETKFANTERTFCQRCLPGSYTNNQGLECKPCDAGYYCPEGIVSLPCPDGLTSFSMSESCNRECPAGMACAGGKTLPCINNTYSTGGASNCTTCDAGSFVTNGNTACNLCPPGSFCVNGQQMLCPQGSISRRRGTESCEECTTPGTYTDSSRLACNACPIGFSCASPKADPAPCYIAQKPSTWALYSDEPGLAQCKTCTSGSHTSSKAGESCTLCSRGFFCSDGALPYPCPNGTYTQSTGASSVDHCKEEFCPKYFHCFSGVASEMSADERRAVDQAEKRIIDALADARRKRDITIAIVAVSVGAALLICALCCCGACTLGTCLHKAHKLVKRHGEATALATQLLQGYEKDVELDQLDEDVNRARLMVKQSLMEIAFEELTILEKIGSGGSASVVFKAEWNQLMVAVKMFNVRRLTGETHYAEFEKELSIMSGLRHPRLVSFYGCSLQYPRIGLVMEFCAGGTLSDWVKRGVIREMPRETVLQILYQICEGMVFLHRRGVIHRDCKLENVLLGDAPVQGQIPNVKISDFGLARHIENVDQVTHMTGGIGTSYYCAPEVTKQTTYDTKADVYSFSMMLFEMFTGEMAPYGSSMPPLQVQLKSAHDPMFRPDIAKVEGGEYRDFASLIQACWDDDPQKRPDFETLLGHFRVEQSGGGMMEKREFE